MNKIAEILLPAIRVIYRRSIKNISLRFLFLNLPLLTCEELKNERKLRHPTAPKIIINIPTIGCMNGLHIIDNKITRPCVK